MSHNQSRADTYESSSQYRRTDRSGSFNQHHGSGRGIGGGGAAPPVTSSTSAISLLYNLSRVLSCARFPKAEFSSSSVYLTWINAQSQSSLLKRSQFPQLSSETFCGKNGNYINVITSSDGTRVSISPPRSGVNPFVHKISDNNISVHEQSGSP
ncbi:hypothetical protein P3S68_019331 [Capsicum galapagoense]